MWHTARERSRGSGLILTLGVLALLAVMASTFILLMRIDSRLTRIQTDDVLTEMLAAGVSNYCMSVLRDDQDRTIYKYENRDQAVGDFRDYGTGMLLHIPGRNTDYWAADSYRYGTATSNDVWFHSADANPYASHTDLYGGRASLYESPQASFGGEHYEFCIVDENSQPITDPVDQNQPRRYYALVQSSDNGLSHDLTGFLTHGYRCYLHPGEKLSGDSRLSRGVYWRWAAKIGTPEERYLNLNAAGNNELFTNAGRDRLNDLDGHGLTARVDGDVTAAPSHLGILCWKGYPGEYQYGKGGFGRNYNAVQYSPYQLDPYRLLTTEWRTMTGSKPDGSGGNEQPPPLLSTTVVQPMAPEWVKRRWGTDGLAADGTDKWRIGWRRDGATYYRIPSPDHPTGDDHYFGASEALTHQNEDIVAGTSRVLEVIQKEVGSLQGARACFGRARGYMSTQGCDTILRGKVWPTEGPLPWRPAAQQGDWRHIDILRRINLNMIGADGPDGTEDPEQTELKNKWLQWRGRERDRLYFMLKAMLDWTQTPESSHEACQVVASLADMVDRDGSETYYAAPDGTDWALGVEKHPVLNEIVFYSKSAANTPEYELFRIRVELYNPWENIPWVPDGDEAYDVSEYVLRVGSHDYRLGSLSRFAGTDPNDEMGPVSDHPVIGADGIYADPDDATPTRQSWSRLMHVGWSKTVNWPPGLTRAELEGPNFAGIEFSLWKPLSDEADPHVQTQAGKVELINGRKHICVDKTARLRLVKPYTGNTGPGGTYPTFLGIYRRWDPTNARVWGTQGSDETSNVLWCPGWNIVTYPTWGRPNVNYPGSASTMPAPGTGTSPYKYERRFEVNLKMPDSDLPSIGWLGELFLVNCAQDGPLTWIHDTGQKPDVPANTSPCTWPTARAENYANRLETAKLDLYRPWGKVHNLNLFDMFTVWDPMHDGVDNDGDGAVDEDDTGYQRNDRLGPEVRVYGVIDMNHAPRRVVACFWPGPLVPYLYYVQCHGLHLERGIATWVAQGPRDTIGDMNRLDGLHGWPGGWMGELGWNWTTYVSSMNLSTTSTTRWGYGKWMWYDDDRDGIIDERDERDFFFTQAANFMTTRSHTFTIEVVAQTTDPPYYPGPDRRRSYNTRRVYTDKHLILLVDRSTTLRIKKEMVNGNEELGPCDFTGPVRVLARRWAHQRR